MKLTVKTLQGVAFPLEAQETDTVESLKEKIENAQGFAKAQQKLIHAGKVLKDDSKLSEYGVKENDFIVVMVTKPKPSRAAPTPAAAPTPVQAPAQAPALATSSQPSAETTPAAPTPATSAPNTSAASSSGSATATAAPASTNAGTSSGEETNAAVQQLCDMGFPEDQVRAALRAAFNNPDRAVEYLMNGIPSSSASVTPAEPAATNAPTSGAEALQALRRHPQFNTFRQQIQQNPASLPQVLQAIGSQDPNLLSAIHQNQEEFLRLLNEPVSETESTPAPQSGASSGGMDLGSLGGGGMPSPQQIQQLVDSLSDEQLGQMAQQMGMSAEQLRGLSQMLSQMPPEAMQQMMASGGMGGEGGAVPPGAVRIELTQEEMSAVDRLCDLGFDRNEVVQAYLACDKNEALAANFLMDSMQEDMNASGGSGGAGGAGGDNDDIYG